MLDKIEALKQEIKIKPVVVTDVKVATLRERMQAIHDGLVFYVLEVRICQISTFLCYSTPKIDLRPTSPLLWAIIKIHNNKKLGKRAYYAMIIEVYIILLRLKYLSKSN